MEKSKSIKALKISCNLNDDHNPLDDLFEVLKNPVVLKSTRRYTERDLPKSFFNPRSLNPKREEQIKQARLGHFQSLRRIRKTSENEPIKSHTLGRITETMNIHKRSISAPSTSKESMSISHASRSGTNRRKMLQARQAHFKLVQTMKSPNSPSAVADPDLDDSRVPFSGLSFKTQDIPVGRIPLPKNWEMVTNMIDGNEEIYFRNSEASQNTRQDPRIPIKTHLEELHCQLTTEMISRINNPSAFNPDNEQPDLDLPSGCCWRQTDRGEVFFANDSTKTTSWLHPRVELQLLKQKLPPLNSQPAERKQKIEFIPSHKKQISVDSGVGSTCSIHHKKQRSFSFQRVRSISGNSITDGRLTIHDIPTETDFSEKFSPMSLSPEPRSEARSESPMDTSFDCSSQTAFSEISTGGGGGGGNSFGGISSPSVQSIASPASIYQHGGGSASLRKVVSPSMDSMYVNRHHASTPIEGHDDDDDRIVLEEVPDNSNPHFIATPTSSQETRSSSQLSHASNQSFTSTRSYNSTPGRVVNSSNIFCVSPPLLLDNQLPPTLKPSLPLEDELYSATDLFDSPPGGVNLLHHMENQNNIHSTNAFIDSSPESFITNLLNDEDLHQLRFDSSDTFY